MVKDGDVAPLKKIVALKEKFSNVYTLIDDCHGAGVIGIRGRGSAEHCGVNVDIINGTLGMIFCICLLSQHFIF